MGPAMAKIADVHAREILDSRGNPTVEVDGIGWWIMIREFGNTERFPGVPAASNHAAIEAACPIQMVAISGRTYCMVS